MQATLEATPSLDSQMQEALILLADDEEIVRTVVRLTLEAHGASFLEADNGTDALRLAQEHLPDIAILDWMMPGLSGLQIVKALKAEPRTSAVQSILLTGNGERYFLDQGHKAGVFAYLVKPFRPRELVQVVESTLFFVRCEATSNSPTPEPGGSPAWMPQRPARPSRALPSRMHSRQRSSS